MRKKITQRNEKHFIHYDVFINRPQQRNTHANNVSIGNLFTHLYANWNKQALSSNRKLQNVVCCLEAGTDRQTRRQWDSWIISKWADFCAHVIIVISIFVSLYKFLVTRFACHIWIKIDHHWTISFINHLFRCQLIPSSLDLTPHLQYQQPWQQKQQQLHLTHLNFDESEIAQYAHCACNHSESSFRVLVADWNNPSKSISFFAETRAKS